MGSVFISGVVFTCFLKVYSCLTMSGGMGATMNLNTTIAFILVMALPIGCLLRGCMLTPGTLVSKMSLDFLDFVLFVTIVTNVIRLIRVTIRHFDPSLCTSLNVFLPLVTMGYTVVNTSLFVRRHRFVGVNRTAACTLNSNVN